MKNKDTIFAFDPNMPIIDNCQCYSFRNIAEDRIKCTNCGATFTEKNNKNKLQT